MQLYYSNLISWPDFFAGYAHFYWNIFKWDKLQNEVEVGDLVILDRDFFKQK